MKQVVSYIRVSTEKQSDHGVSLEAQEAKIRAMAVVHGVELGDVIVDAGESAKTLNRAGMLRLLGMVDRGEVKMVIIAKLDRLTRSVKDLAGLLERFEKRGVSLVSVAESLDTSSAAGRLVLNIMVSVSQWELEAVSARTRDALRHKASQGERVGTIPFGFRLAGDGVHLEPDASEMALIDRARELRASGLTLRGVAESLNAEGQVTRRGTAWRVQYVANLLPKAQGATA